MAEEKGSLRDQLIVATVQTLVFGVLLAVFGFWLNVRLERYKSELANETEKVKTALQVTTPLIQRRLSGYLEIQQAARNVNEVLEMYYSRANEPPTGEVMRGKLRALENAMNVGSGSSGGGFVLKTDATQALHELVKAREKYADISSAKVNATVDLFLNTVMDDLSKTGLKGNDTASFDTTARAHLKDVFGRLNSEINQALGVDEFPIK
jgi:small nuclear ribonucleoprotein (snRNP)-like protein